jgi:XTP/dITP diphosphohydrolase
MKLLFATNNPGKVKELKQMSQSEGMELLTLSDLGSRGSQPLVFVPDETGATFEENAVQKARETANFLAENGYKNFAVLADDSGLEIDALDGKPGVDSALFVGRETPYTIRNAKILDDMKNVPNAQRTARFICVIACVLPSGENLTTRAALEGVISHAPKGENGFGYDPIFYLPEHGKTTAELSQEEKNKLSHRGLAFNKMLEVLKCRVGFSFDSI